MTRPGIPWRERTLSVLDAQRDEACSRGLYSACGQGSVFGQGSSRTWISAYEDSYLARESAPAGGTDVAAVRRSVRGGLAAELPLVSIREEMLLQRMMIFGGSSPLLDEEEYPAALSLVRRLWCTVQEMGPEMIVISLHDSLAPKIAAIMQGPDYHARRQQMFTLSATLHSLLYLNGFLFARTMISQFLSKKREPWTARSGKYLTRFLLSEFDYLWNDQKELILLHPGLCCPEEVISSMSGLSFQEPHFTHQMILDGMRELLEEEKPAVETLKAELEGALQPEFRADETVNELKLLVKQGAGLQDIRDILAPQMATAFHPGVLAALNRLHAETVRWAGVANGVLN